MRTFLEKLMFFILISMYLMGQQVEVFTIFLGLCIFIFSLSMEVFENSWIQRIALVISGALCIVFPECVLYISCRSTVWTPRNFYWSSPPTASKSINITTNRYWNISYFA
mgnify:CR=1 FL=1